MKKLRDNSWAVGLCSFLTVLTTAATGNSPDSVSRNDENLGSSHSLILPDDGSRFTE